MTTVISPLGEVIVCLETSTGRVLGGDEGKDDDDGGDIDERPVIISDFWSKLSISFASPGVISLRSVDGEVEDEEDEDDTGDESSFDDRLLLLSSSNSTGLSLPLSSLLLLDDNGSGFLATLSNPLDDPSNCLSLLLVDFLLFNQIF